MNFGFDIFIDKEYIEKECIDTSISNKWKPKVHQTQLFVLFCTFCSWNIDVAKYLALSGGVPVNKITLCTLPQRT